VGLPSALAVLIIAPEVFLPLRRASAEFHESTEGLAAARRAMDAAASAESGRRSPQREAPLDPARAAVALRRVRVEFAGRDRPVLDDASLVIEPGERVVIMGANGTGKSTTIALLLGLVQPAHGSVEVGGRDLRELDVEAWRRSIAYLPEHPTLLAASLADNLRLARPEATDQQLVDALRAAGAEDLLARLPGRLATRIGEGGRALSAGERQRVALARALVRRASLYLLDEPTAHLDRATECAVIDSLAETLGGCSALIVTHRKPVLRLADRVIVLEGGRFVASQSAPGLVAAEIRQAAPA
jgi:ATP-binding cassette, subfamily C, bacterial CydD